MVIAAAVVAFLLLAALVYTLYLLYQRQNVIAEKTEELVDQTNHALEQHRERLADLEAIHYTLYGPFGHVKAKAHKC